MAEGRAPSPAAVSALADLDPLTGVPLSRLSRWSIGGPADLVVAPANRAQLAQALRVISDHGLAHVVIGDGSNLLFDDHGFRGVVVRIGRAFAGVTLGEDGDVQAGAGHWTPSLVRQTISAGLSGLVHAIGIPGAAGGLAVMNGGSQRRSFGETLTWLDAMTFDGRVERYTPADLGLGYRRSDLQRGDRVVLALGLQLVPGDRGALRREALDILAARRRKFPRVRANCGSVFVSDPQLYQVVGPPGAAIERVGLKGARRGGAQISPEHANFIVNLGGATARDVLRLIDEAREAVLKATGVAMVAEVRYLRPDGRLAPAHDADQAPAAAAPP